MKSTATQRREQRERTQMFNSDQQILITQVVGSVMPDPQGERSMVQTAYLVAAEFIENNANDTDPIDLTWEVNGHHFNAQYYPKRNEATAVAEAY